MLAVLALPTSRRETSPSSGCSMAHGMSPSAILQSRITW
jgi:hypothetical protein